jgi:hypothetical protein
MEYRPRHLSVSNSNPKRIAPSDVGSGVAWAKANVELVTLSPIVNIKLAPLRRVQAGKSKK